MAVRNNICLVKSVRQIHPVTDTSWDIFLFSYCIHQVGLYLSSYSQHSVRSICSATLIAPEWLITAAHCITGIAPNKTFPVGHPFDLQQTIKRQTIARLGNHYRTVREPGQREIIVKMASLHPNFDQAQPSNGYDVAVLKLHSPVSVCKSVSEVVASVFFSISTKR